MARRAPSRCTRCPKLATNAGRCDDHQPEPWANASANTRTLTSRERAAFRAAVMRDADGRCAWCGNPATIADHIIEIADGGDPYDHRGNGQALCTTCDEKKTRAAARLRAKRRAQKRR